MPRGTILWVGLITLLIAINYSWREVQRTSICDTTYIYEGYADVKLPSGIISSFPRYKLVRYNDKAPQLQQDIATLRRRHRPIPLLFVHGHLGSPQQMRSMASETSREVIRRYKSASTTKEPWNLWIDWYAANFNEEPSAFEPHLLEEQAQFVAACLTFLSNDDDTATPISPLLLVGYSMGGLVVESALEKLDSNEKNSKILPRLAVVVTLGAPRHHLPIFLASSSSTRNASSMVHAPPSVHILAGPGDLMIPGLSSWASVWENKSKRKGGNSGTMGSTTPNAITIPVQVDMDDVPGVWCTASHKGMISCNQLVRQTVPMLVDAAVAALPTASTSAARAPGQATATAAALKMTTSLLKGMPESISQTKTLLKEVKGGLVEEAEEKQGASTSCRCVSPSPTTEKIEEFDSIFTQQLQRDKQQNLCYIWEAKDRYKALKKGSLFFLFSGLAPESEIKFFVEYSKDGIREEVDVSGLARPLSGMMEKYPSATDATSKRPWHVILDGVDWMQNSTRILRLPFGADSESFSKIKLEINSMPPSPLSQTASSVGPPPTFIAQFLPSPTKLSQTKPSYPLHLAAGKHPVALRLDPLELTASSFSFPITAAAVMELLNKLMHIVIGPAPPFRIQATQIICPNTPGNHQISSDKAPLHTIPLLVAVDGNENKIENFILIGDSVRKAHQGLSRWHPSVVNRDIWFISDPRCSYTVSLTWDLGPWISYTLRYHAYAIIPLAFALSLLNLEKDFKSEVLSLAFPLLLLLLLPALSSVWPEHAAALLGRPPWLPLSSIDVFLLGCVAYTVLASLKLLFFKLQKFSTLLLLNYFPFTSSTATGSTTPGLQGFMYIVVLVSSSVHPAMPALIGVILLQLSTNLIATTAAPPPLLVYKNSWLITHILASLPAGIWLFGWIASGRSHGYPLFSFEKVCMLLQGAHSCCVAFTTTTPTNSVFSVIYEKLSLFLAFFVAFSGLWGSLHAVIPTMAIICGWELVLGLVQRGTLLEKSKRR